MADTDTDTQADNNIAQPANPPANPPEGEIPDTPIEGTPADPATPPAEPPAEQGADDSNSLLGTPDIKDEFVPLDFTTGQKPEALDDKYWDAESNAPDVNAILKDLEGTTKRAEGLRKALGAKGAEPSEPPADVSGYTIELGEGMELPQDDTDLIGSIKEKALAAGISADAFSSVMGVAIQEVLEHSDLAQKSDEEIAADNALHRETELKKLGANGEAVVNAVDDWLKGEMSKGVLTESDYQALRASATTAETIKAFNRLRINSGGDPNIAIQIEGKSVEATKAEAYRLVNTTEFRNGDPETVARYEKIVNDLHAQGIVLNSTTG